MGTSLVTARPTTSARPDCSSIDWSPVVLSSLNTGAEYTSVGGSGEGQRPQHGLCFGFGFGELARGHGVRHDARARLHHDAIAQHHGRPDGDRRVEILRAPADLAAPPRLPPPPLRLHLLTYLPRHHFPRSRH